MIQEMERVIHKRDAIQLKYEPKAQQDPNSGLQIKRQLTSLRSNLKLAMQSAQEQRTGRGSVRMTSRSFRTTLRRSRRKRRISSG